MTAAHRLEGTARSYVLALYATGTVGYYLFTWYGYGGWAPGHPPLWNLEEFVAASGLKFTVYFVLSCVLYRWLWPVAIQRGPAALLAGLLVGLLAFTFAARSLQAQLLEIFGWVQFFGGSRAVLNDAISAGFYLLQSCVLLSVRAAAPLPASPVAPGTPDTVPAPVTLVKGELTVIVPWQRVAYLKAYGNYCRAWVNGETYLLNQGIGAAEATAGPVFLRVHRSYLINVQKLRGLRRSGRSTLAELDEGAVVPVARGQVTVVRERMAADRSSPG